MDYVTTTEVNTFLGTSWEDSLITLLWDMVESFLHTSLRITSFSTATYNEFHEATFPLNLNEKHFYILKELNPTVLTAINDINVSSDDYLLEGRMLNLDTTYTVDDWNRVKFTYTAWFSTIPQDVKSMVLYGISGLYNARKGVGIKSFTQGQLTVSYNSQAEVDMFSSMYKSLMEKYKKNDIFVAC